MQMVLTPSLPWRFESPYPSLGAPSVHPFSATPWSYAVVLTVLECSRCPLSRPGLGSARLGVRQNRTGRNGPELPNSEMARLGRSSVARSRLRPPPGSPQSRLDPARRPQALGSASPTSPGSAALAPQVRAHRASRADCSNAAACHEPLPGPRACADDAHDVGGRSRTR